MTQQIIVLLLFVAVIGYNIYRFFFRKGSKSSGCDKCLPGNKGQETGDGRQESRARSQDKKAAKVHSNF